jgi:adenylate cyclase
MPPLATEIERKFRLTDQRWRADVARRAHLRQGYIANTPLASVRVRVADDRGWLSVKSVTPGMTRDEYEVGIAAADAGEMLKRLCQGGRIEKWRHIVPYQGSEWEIDEFLGDNTGLVIAELELDSEAAAFARPPWLGEEVTRDQRYYNIRLSERPFRDWPENRSERR